MNTLGILLLIAALLTLGGLISYKVFSEDPSGEDPEGGSGHPNRPYKR